MFTTSSAALSLVLLSLTAIAAPCETDADCASGYRCEITSFPVAPACESPPCDDPAPGQVERACEYAHPTCATDADCGAAYLSCNESGGSSCASSDGSPCDAPSVEKTCGAREIDCQSDANCPADFQCSTVTVTGCDNTACDGPDCTPPDCNAVTKSLCIPHEIECTSDASCPSPWSCALIRTHSGDCSDEEGGDDSSGTGTGTAGGSSNSGGSKAPPQAKDCTSSTRQLCMPPGWGPTSSSSDSFGDGSATAESGDDSGASKNAASNDSSSDSGCAVSRPCTTSSPVQRVGLVGLMLGLVGLVAARRRRTVIDASVLDRE